MKLLYKIWLDQNGKAFGDGPYELLKRVESTHSLHQAAGQMEMSYSKAWRLRIDNEGDSTSSSRAQSRRRIRRGLADYSEGERIHDTLWAVSEEAKQSLEHIYEKHFCPHGKESKE